MSARESQRPQVLVAILTFRRPDCLERLLPLLVDQVAALPGAHLLVVDNDPDGGAAGQVGSWADRGVRYAHQPVPGISAARNLALDTATGATATGDTDALVFMDDDDLPGPEWLERLVGAWQQWQCEAVTGPVSVVLPDDADPWLAASGVLERSPKISGTPVEGAATNNLLLDLRAVRRLGLRFDERLGLIGGEDALFTRQLTRGGGRILWCAEAEIRSELPPDRRSRRWILRRQFRAGGSWSRMMVSLADGPTDRARVRVGLIGRAATRLVIGSARMLTGCLTRRLSFRADGACQVASALGSLLGTVGYVYAEYGRGRAVRPAG